LPRTGRRRHEDGYRTLKARMQMIQKNQIDAESDEVSASELWIAVLGLWSVLLVLLLLFAMTSNTQPEGQSIRRSFVALG
jgi:hypothetical protein